MVYNYPRVAYYVAALLHHTRWSRQKLLEYQNRKLREIVKYAYEHVPFYHQKFSQANLKPDDVKNVDDLNKVPIVNRDELQENYEKLISDEFKMDRLKVASTSGSTGKPFFTYLTEREDAFRKAKLLRPHIVCGQKPRDKWVIIGPPWHHGKIGRVQRFLGVYAPIFVSIFDAVPDQISKISRIKPDVLDGYTSSLILLANELDGMGSSIIKPKFLMGGAELIDDKSREYIENVFGVPYYDQYASEEFQMLAWQCPEKDEYHIDADTVVMQFLDDNDEEVSPGEEGRIVCTSLFNYAMPIIRYELGDIGVPSGESECACGRKFPLMKMIKGRKEEIVVLPDGRKFAPVAIGDLMCAFKYFNMISQYRFIQKKIDEFKILIKRKNESVPEITFKTELLNHVRRILKINEADVVINVELVNEIPPDKSGKIRKVVSEL